MTEKFIDEVPRLAVDLLVIQAREGREPRHISDYDAIIIRRSDCDLMAITGGMLDKWETLVDAAIREFKEETNITIERDWFTSTKPVMFDNPTRDPRGSHTVSAAYMAVIPPEVKYIPVPQEGEVKEVIRIPVQQLLGIARTNPDLLVADHELIIEELLIRFSIELSVRRYRSEDDYV